MITIRTANTLKRIAEMYRLKMSGLPEHSENKTVACSPMNRPLFPKYR